MINRGARLTGGFRRILFRSRALGRQTACHPTETISAADADGGFGASLCENAGSRTNDATIKLKSNSRRIFDARAVLCLNQSCAQMISKAVFTQPRACSAE